MNAFHAFLITLIVSLAAAVALAADPPQSIEHAVIISGGGKPAVPVVLGGDLDYPAEAVVTRSGTIVVGDDDSTNYQLRMQVMFGQNGWTDLHLYPSNLEDPARNPSAYRVMIRHMADGKMLLFQPYEWDAGESKFLADKYHGRRFYFSRNDRKSLANIAADDIEPITYLNRFLDVRIDVTSDRLVIWVENNAVFSAPVPAPGHGKMYLGFTRETRIRQIEVTPFTGEGLFNPVVLGPSANDTFKKPITRAKEIDLGGVTFDIAPGGRDYMSLLDAQWVDEERDPPSYYSLYDGGPYVLGDKRMPFLRVPLADYAAVHLLAYAEDDAEKYTNRFAIRAGRYGYSDQVVQQDFEGSVPRASEAASIDESQKVETPAGTFFHVRMPLDRVFAQDVTEGILEMELTKPLVLTRHHPDPNRFRWRPLGLPSGVRIAAITLEKSPLQIKVTSDELGHAFVEPKTPVFKIHLTNITDAAQPYSLTAKATHLRGGETKSDARGSVEPGATSIVELPIDPVRRGFHDIAVTLTCADGNVVLTRHTTFAQLMPDKRKHREAAPWGSWTWAGGHFTSRNADDTGQLFWKLGFRYGMGGDPIEARKKYGVLPGNEPSIHSGIERYEKLIELRPDTPKTALIFHETSISGPHVTRVPDIFHDRPPYQLNEREQAQFDKMWKMAFDNATIMREKYPDVFLKFGNGPLPTKEEFYRHKFPAELFDAGGNEPGSFGRLPERQPPDYVGNNASIWMDHQLLKHYGYGDKPVRQCYEIGYPNDNPCNVDSRDQANYFVRHVLHSMAWEMPFIHLGEIMDVGNSYYYSNWGASGFCKPYPEMNVKPAYAQLAVMTNMLDGAKLHKIHDAGSDGVYAVEFVRADGQHVLAFWVGRGSRPLDVTRDGTWTLVDDQGNETQSPAAVVAAESPQWLIGPGDIGAIKPGKPAYADKPAAGATVVAPLASLDGWTIETTRSPELEVYNFMAPRRKGDFVFKPTSGGISITPKPIDYGKDTMAMYAVLAHDTGIELPGKPENLGLWINGNSGWGRIIYELTDAGGERWISIGAQAKGEANPWLLDWMSAEMLAELGKPEIADWNTNDSHGISSINFDGWRYVAFPLPGNFPYENHYKPANNWWRHADDGVVQYPLTLRKIVVELPEKILHLTDWRAPKNPTIEIKNLTAE